MFLTILTYLLRRFLCSTARLSCSTACTHSKIIQVRKRLVALNLLNRLEEIAVFR